jgi:hypothetical protein
MKVGDLVRYLGWFDGNLNQLGIIVRLGDPTAVPPCEQNLVGYADSFWTKVYVFGKGERRCSVKSWEVINESR